jgi:hypothetical protein
MSIIKKLRAQALVHTYNGHDGPARVCESAAKRLEEYAKEVKELKSNAPEDIGINPIWMRR